MSETVTGDPPSRGGGPASLGPRGPQMGPRGIGATKLSAAPERQRSISLCSWRPSVSSPRPPRPRPDVVLHPNGWTSISGHCQPCGNHTVPAGSRRLLVFAVAYYDNSNQQTITVNYGGVPMTKVDPPTNHSLPNGPETAGAELFYSEGRQHPGWRQLVQRHLRPGPGPPGSRTSWPSATPSTPVSIRPPLSQVSPGPRPSTTTPSRSRPPPSVSAVAGGRSRWPPPGGAAATTLMPAGEPAGESRRSSSTTA